MVKGREVSWGREARGCRRDSRVRCWREACGWRMVSRGVRMEEGERRRLRDCSVVKLAKKAGRESRRPLLRNSVRKEKCVKEG